MCVRGGTVCHFPSRGRSTRIASLRGFLQISSPVSSVSPVWPVEARWQLQLTAQQRLVWKEWKKGMRTKLMVNERQLTLESKYELCKCPSQYPQAYFPTKNCKECISAKEKEKKKFLRCYRFFEVFVWSLAFAFCLFLHWRLISFSSLGLKQKSLLRVGCKCQPTSCLLFWLS